MITASLAKLVERLTKMAVLNSHHLNLPLHARKIKMQKLVSAFSTITCFQVFF